MTADGPYKNVLWVDDNEPLLRGLTRAFPESSFAATGAEAIVLMQVARAEGCPYQVLVSDLLMEPMDGVALLEEARRVSPTTRRVLLTAAEDFQVEDALRRARPDGVILKPFVLRDVQGVLDELMKERRSSDSSQSMKAVEPALKEGLREAAQEHREGVEAARACVLPFLPKR